jgi:cyclopropane fatty-acyl-phospholipid synthase-like methyltransferase
MGIVHDIRHGQIAKAVGRLLPGCHQLPNLTALNRYPEIFAAAAAAAPHAKRVLSFGCSTGEECVTLAEYFPGAEIVGTDINPVNLFNARKHRNQRIRFAYAHDRILRGFGGFDVVFCMAVLRTSAKRGMYRYYPFHRFVERAQFLESLVKPEGLLVIHNATYRFSDAPHRFTYDSVPVVAEHDKVFLPDGKTETEPDGCIFRRMSP